MKRGYDAVVIGAGHNGLVAASLLARAGLSVCVLEASSLIGGACRSEVLWDKYRVSTAAYVCGLLHPAVIRELELDRRGLTVLKRDPSSFTPLPDSGYLLLGPDDRFNAEQIALLDKRDVEAFLQYERDLEAIGPIVDHIFLSVPPSFPVGSFTDILRWTPLVNRLFQVPPSGRLLLAQMLSCGAWDVLDRRFRSELLKITLATDGIIGSPLSPTFPGTGLVLLHHTTGSVTGKRGLWGYVRGGMGSLPEAIASYGREKGVTIATECPVSRIITTDGRVKGVVLTDGREISCRTVLSNADPKRTFLTLCDPQDLPAEFVEQVKRIKMSASAFKINLVCDRLPNFRCLPGDRPAPHHRGTIHLCPSLSYAEEAFADYFYGRPSSKPIIEMCIPTVLDDSLAPPDRHIVSLFVQYAPYSPIGGWGQAKDEFVRRVLETIDEFAPGFSSSVLHLQALSPQDLEAEFFLTGGNIFHGDMTLDQVFAFRPVPGWGQYRTPVKGLYLCGSGAHPGGGVTGCPGWNAARVALDDWKKRRIG